jgi:hypothetical protein
MKRRAFVFAFAALASLASASAQVVPVGSVSQSVIARVYLGIGCTPPNAPTGFGTAALYVPFMPGIPDQYLFRAGAAVQDVTTATLTGVFAKIQLKQTQNGTITNTFLPTNAVNYYYHPNSSPKDWTDFDGFQAGQLIAIYVVGTDMFTTVNGVSMGQGSGPLTYTADFTLPDGEVRNLATLTPGGITVTTLADLKNFVGNADGSPQVVNLTSSTGTISLGSCALMFPFSGVGSNPASSSPRRGRAPASGSDAAKEDDR